MNNHIDNGGPAFPLPQQDFGNGITLQCKHDGMTLRDWFAGMALQGQLSLPEIQLAISRDQITHHNLAAASYEYADAMIAARKEGA